MSVNDSLFIVDLNMQRIVQECYSGETQIEFFFSDL